MVISELNGFSSDQRSLGIHHCVEYSVYSVELVIPNYANRLLAHCTLISISR